MTEGPMCGQLIKNRGKNLLTQPELINFPGNERNFTKIKHFSKLWKIWLHFLIFLDTEINYICENNIVAKKLAKIFLLLLGYFHEQREGNFRENTNTKIFVQTLIKTDCQGTISKPLANLRRGVLIVHSPDYVGIWFGSVWYGATHIRLSESEK